VGQDGQVVVTDGQKNLSYSHPAPSKTASVRYVTKPDISGATTSGLNFDGSPYVFNAINSVSKHPDAQANLVYHWALTAGNLVTNGSEATVSFSIAQQNTVQTLSVYSTDSLGNRSKEIKISLSVGAVVSPSNGILSFPSTLMIGELADLDVTFNNGGDTNTSILWEVSDDDGTTWSNIGFNSDILKSPTFTTNTPAKSYKFKVTLTNIVGSVSFESGYLVSKQIITDIDSTYLNTNAVNLNPTAMALTFECGNTNSGIFKVPVGQEAGTIFVPETKIVFPVGAKAGKILKKGTAYNFDLTGMGSTTSLVKGVNNEANIVANGGKVFIDNIERIVTTVGQTIETIAEVVCWGYYYGIRFIDNTAVILTTSVVAGRWAGGRISGVKKFAGGTCAWITTGGILYYVDGNWSLRSVNVETSIKQASAFPNGYIILTDDGYIQTNRSVVALSKQGSYVDLDEATDGVVLIRISSGDIYRFGNDNEAPVFSGGIGKISGATALMSGGQLRNYWDGYLSVPGTIANFYWNQVLLSDGSVFACQLSSYSLLLTGVSSIQSAGSGSSVLAYIRDGSMLTYNGTASYAPRRTYSFSGITPALTVAPTSCKAFKEATANTGTHLKIENCNPISTSINLIEEQYETPEIVQNVGQPNFTKAEVEMQVSRGTILPAVNNSGNITLPTGTILPVGEKVLLFNGTVSTLATIATSLLNVITVEETIPESLSSVELISVKLSGDIYTNTVSYTELPLTVSVMDSTKLKLEAVVENKDGNKARFKVRSNIADAVLRSQVRFSVGFSSVM
jgi:hypothetical protein